jgi:hypothetical protein
MGSMGLAHGTAVALSVTLVAGGAWAQHRGRGGGGASGASTGASAGTSAGAATGAGTTVTGSSTGSPPLVLQKEQLGTTAFATVARTRMRNGDCAGALDAFDAAIQHSIDPTLHRDRGLCHDQLGHPYPAMEDYRIYLTEEPDAGDAESIREKLARLEEQTSGAPPPKSDDDDDDVPPKESISASLNANASTSGGASGGASASGSAETGGSASGEASSGGSGGDQPDRLDTVEHDNDTLHSSLRRGKGFGIGAAVGFQQWVTSGVPFSEPLSRSESIVVQLRYSFSHSLAVEAELGYLAFNSDGVVSLSGVKTLLGLELRVPLDDSYSQQIYFRPGIEFDAMTDSLNGISGSTGVDALAPELRIGWRPMLAKSMGLEISADVGETKFVPAADFPYGGNGSWSTLVALNVGAAWGF